jgi:DUF4097 and DUF4098 domain-containing protein YvlB
MNRMLKTFTLALGACILAAADVPDKRVEASPGQLLDVNLATGGGIRIHGGSENAVTVRTKLTGRDADLIRVAVERTAKGVSVTAKYEGRSNHTSGGADLDITVPARFDAELRTMGGELRIEGVEGQLHGSTMGGPLNLSGLKGKVEFTTMGGAVNLTSSQVDGRVKTMGGNVKIKDVVGDVKGSSMGGNVTYDNVQRPGKGDGKEVEITTMGGEIKVASAPSGASLKTMGGDIRIGSAREFVKATTMGGDIEIKELDGAVAASTMGGDITVTMVGDPAQGRRDVKLESKGGEIRLTLPAGLSADIDVELDHTRNSSHTYKIDSDFPLAITDSPEWSEGHGSPRKTLKGVASVNGGKHKIVIRTINGNVTIRKR